MSNAYDHISILKRFYVYSEAQICNGNLNQLMGIALRKRTLHGAMLSLVVYCDSSPSNIAALTFAYFAGVLDSGSMGSHTPNHLAS